MSLDPASEFASYLRGKNHLADATAALDLAGEAGDERTLRKLWELTELSASDFADEVAGFFEVPRVGLPELLSATALVKQFSRRFLREMTVFPYRTADGQVMLAVADPSDSAAARLPPSCWAMKSPFRSPPSRISRPPSISAWVRTMSRPRTRPK